MTINLNHAHQHDPDCRGCRNVSLGHVDYLRRRRQFMSRQVRTWCRRCGGSATLQIGGTSYENAVTKLQGLDGVEMEHTGHFHVENGGWGVLFRLDEVLAVAFPSEYQADPRAPFWRAFPELPHLPRAAMEKKVALVGLADWDDDMEQTERARLAQEVNAYPRTRHELLLEYPDVWDSGEMEKDFEVHAFRTPFVIAKRRADGATVSLMFQHEPRFYFNLAVDRIT